VIRPGPQGAQVGRRTVGVGGKFRAAGEYRIFDVLGLVDQVVVHHDAPPAGDLAQQAGLDQPLPGVPANSLTICKTRKKDASGWPVRYTFLIRCLAHSSRLVGRLMCVMPFLDKIGPTADWVPGASAGATQSVASLTTSLAAGSAFAAPFKGSWVEIPTLCDAFQKGDDLLGSFWGLSCQTPAYQNALHGFGHVQPGAANWCVQRHDPMFDQPAYKAWCMVTTQIIPNEQHAQGWQVFGQFNR